MIEHILTLEQNWDMYNKQLELNNRILKAKFDLTIETMNEDQRVQWVLNYCRAANHEIVELFNAYVVDDQQNQLVELVDILHFLLSIAQVMEINPDMKLEDFEYTLINVEPKDLSGFLYYNRLGSSRFFNTCLIFHQQLVELEECINYRWWGTKTNDWDRAKIELQSVWNAFRDMTFQLGFTSDQIYSAYCQKNLINHDRQNKGYNIDEKTEDDNKTIEVN